MLPYLNDEIFSDDMKLSGKTRAFFDAYSFAMLPARRAKTLYHRAMMGQGQDVKSAAGLERYDLLLPLQYLADRYWDPLLLVQTPAQAATAASGQEGGGGLLRSGSAGPKTPKKKSAGPTTADGAPATPTTAAGTPTAAAKKKTLKVITDVRDAMDPAAFVFLHEMLSMWFPSKHFNTVDSVNLSMSLIETANAQESVSLAKSYTAGQSIDRRVVTSSVAPMIKEEVELFIECVSKMNDVLGSAQLRCKEKGMSSIGMEGDFDTWLKQMTAGQGPSMDGK